MSQSVVLKVPAEHKYIKLVEDTLRDVCAASAFNKADLDAVIESTKELMGNAIEHAYPDEEGYVQISVHPFETGVRVDVHDWGVPMSHSKYQSVPLDPNASKGFNRIYRLVDRFEYKNLGKEGKKFIIIKYLSHPVHKRKKHAPALHPLQTTVPENIPVTIRDFQEGDEEGIAYLIYKNYGHSYIKESFYYPRRIAREHGERFYSVVAESEGKIVGHFAFVLIPESTIAEIGIVVVDPRYKGRGIMNKMIERILQKAQSVGLDAVFGEAIMYHVFSQRSNLRHGFSESALMIGRTPADITLENNELTKVEKRGAVLIGYKFFQTWKRKLFLPNVYKKQITKTYKNADINFKKAKTNKKKEHTHVFLSYEFDPPTNIATIRIDRYGKDFKRKFLLLVAQLRAKHCDMIYADVSLQDIPQIEKVVNIMNKRGFFYCGVMFLWHKQKDYLRLQMKHSDKVGNKNYICYSDFCKALSRYIKADEKRCKGL